MTNSEKQIKSMLNYFQIDTGGKKDEKMTKRDQKAFLDRLNANYDAHTVHDLLSKIKDKLKDNKPEDEESDDPFFDKLKNESESEKIRYISLYTKPCPNCRLSSYSKYQIKINYI